MKPQLTVSLASETGPVFHGASGALYGLSEDGVPRADLLAPLHVRSIAQKPPGGLQHPTGDTDKVAPGFFGAGGERILVYMQDTVGLTVQLNSRRPYYREGQIMTDVRRTAIVGTGSRAQLFTRGLAQRARYTVAALCDPSPTRMAYHNRLLIKAGNGAASLWSPGAFTEMLATEGITDVVVSTVDAVHDHYIVPALEAGCRVVTEKPMTVDAARCQSILDATSRTGRPLTVAFNYRYNPVHERVWRLLREQVIGEILSVHFEWLLDVRHGADYFRRWHREKAVSGGLMVHKASHHFDLVNWWLGSEPREVFGYGRLGFYGAEAGTRHGLRRDYERAYNSPQAREDPFALDISGPQRLRELYLDAEADSGYLRDRNVFDGEISIEDDMAVLVRYASGASMTYHLTAYSPWEGYRVMFNGSAGRLELEVTESRWQPRLDSAAGAIHGEVAMPNAGGATIRLRRLWEPPAEVPVASGHGGHGGGDERMLAALYGPRAPGGEPEPGDAARQSADQRDGAMALAVGIAANECFLTGQPVRIADLIALGEPRTDGG